MPHPIPPPPPIAVARAVVGLVAAVEGEGEGEDEPTAEGSGAERRGAEHSMPSVVLTLYRQPDGDGTYSLVMHRGGSEGRR